MTRSLRRSRKPEYELIPVRQKRRDLPKVNYSVPDSSVFRVDKSTGRVTGILTDSPKGVRVGWDACGQCNMFLTQCTCAGGISCPADVAYIFVSFGGAKPEPPPLAVTFRAPSPAPKKNPKPKRTLRRPEPVKQFRKLKRH